MKAATTALKSEYGTHYRYGPIHKVIYQAGGGSGDYIYDVLGVKYSFALELRDTGRYAFLLPVEQILPTVKVRKAKQLTHIDHCTVMHTSCIMSKLCLCLQETWSGLQAMAFSIGKEYPVRT